MVGVNDADGDDVSLATVGVVGGGGSTLRNRRPTARQIGLRRKRGNWMSEWADGWTDEQTGGGLMAAGVGG